MTRITGSDSIIDALVKLSDGNPGAINVLTGIVKHGSEIDRDSVGPLFSILFLDTLELYGPSIWILYKKVCKQNLILFLAVIRACQLGIISEEDIKISLKPDAYNLDVEDIHKKVCERLPNFTKEIEHETYERHL